MDLIRQSLLEAGRDPSNFGFEARISYGSGDPDSWTETLRGWEEIGVEHISLNTMGAGFTTAEEHLKALSRFALSVGLYA